MLRYICGESAGAGSVLQHIAHGGNTQPLLFNAAIASSTALPPQYYNDWLPQVSAVSSFLSGESQYTDWLVVDA